MKHEIIYRTYPKVIKIDKDVAYDIDGNVVTIDENSQAYLTEKQNLEQEKQAKETVKATAKQKLIDLGLTAEEIKALIGV